MSPSLPVGKRPPNTITTDAKKPRYPRFLTLFMEGIGVQVSTINKALSKFETSPRYHSKEFKIGVENEPRKDRPFREVIENLREDQIKKARKNTLLRLPDPHFSPIR